VLDPGAGAVPQRQAAPGSARRTRDGITVYDDFAHHPTAIRTTLAGLRAKVGGRVVVAMEPRSNSMRLGRTPRRSRRRSTCRGCRWCSCGPELPWDADKVIAGLRGEGIAVADVDRLLAELQARLRPGDQVVFMSNGGFEGAPQRFAEVLRGR
jgi:UDP-N-acetylmuramate: L-alanyl-gamma-D-glutamyl-meso-diaminopimelate ligase